MEKAKKRLISSAVLVAIVAVVVFCALIFGQGQNAGNPMTEGAVAVTGNQSGGMISGIYNEMSQSEAMAHYNSLTDYTEITNQSDFEYYLGNNKPVTGGKYRLKPYDDYGNKITYTAKSATYLDSTIIDGCGATIQISSLDDITEIGSGGNTAQEILNLPNGDKGYGTGTMFQFTPREVRFGLIKYDDEPVYIKASGGFADYTLGATISNINFEYTANFSRGESEDAASYIYGGVFGIMSVNDAGQGTTVTNCRIYNGGTFSARKKVNGGARVGNQSRPYHATVSFGTLAGYCYNSSFTDSTVELSSSMSVYTYSVGNDQAGNNTGTPRAVSAGAIGIIQNNSVVSDIYITGGGSLNGDVGTAYYETTNSAKMGLAGGLVGCVVDQNSSAEEFMVAGQGNAYIKNIVSNWQGTVTMKGNVHGSYDYTTTINQTGSLVGISGNYINNGTATNISGNYFIYGDSKPTYRMVAYGNVADAEFSYVQVIEDGNNWLNISGEQRKVDIEFSEDGNNLNLIYDVSDDVANRSILWSYTKTVTDSEGTTSSISEFWNAQDATSYDTATKRNVISINNSSKVQHAYSFVTGQAVYYKVAGQDDWSYTDSSIGSMSGDIGVRTYNSLVKEYDAQILAAPDVEFYLEPEMTNRIATSNDGSQWIIQNNGSGLAISVGDVQTKNVGNWYFSLQSDSKTDIAYAYTVNIDGKNYVAYKSENQPVSSQEEIQGMPISMRYYVYTINQKEITPSIVAKSADELIYDATVKSYSVNFNGEICSGDTVNATLEYFTVSGDNESSIGNAIDAGTYRVKITGLSDSNYKLSDAVANHDFEITKRELTSVISGATEFVYNAKNQSPDITINNQLPGVDQSAVISIVYRKDGVTGSNIDAGTYTVVVELATDAVKNYNLSGDKEKTFTINPADLTYYGAEEYSFVYDSLEITYQKLSKLQENPISIVCDETGETIGFSVSFRDYGSEDEYEKYVYNCGVYECLIESNDSSNYNKLSKSIKISITPATVTFDIIRNNTPDENGNYVYTGKNVSFAPSYKGLGTYDIDKYGFIVRIYPAVYDSESATWVKQEGAEGSTYVKNAGNYIAVIEQTKGDDIATDTNYDVTSAPGTRELAFTINKAELVWTFTGGEGLEYHEESGEYYATYNGQYFTMDLGSADLESQLAEGDKGGKYMLTGNVEYYRETTEGNVYEGVEGVRNANTYIVVPEVSCGNMPSLDTNYNIKGGTLVIQQRVVTIVVEDIEMLYGTEFDTLSEETFASMWYYAEGSEQFLEEDGQVLTFVWTDGVPDSYPVRGTYPFEFRPSYINTNSLNYDIRRVYTAGTNSRCTILGHKLELEIVVTDKNGTETVFPAGTGREAAANIIYNGGEYTVSLRVTNEHENFPAIEWITAEYKFTNNSDSTRVTFELAESTAGAYYIGEETPVGNNDDRYFYLDFTVDKRIVTITPNDTEVEYGATFLPAGNTVGGDGFADGEEDWFTYNYNTDLAADVDSTANITVEAVAKSEHSGAENNYEFQYGTGTAIRIAKTLHVTLNNRTKTYGDSPLTVGSGDYTVTESLVGDDTLQLEYVITLDGEEITDAANLPVGVYALSVKVTNTNNYNLIVNEDATCEVNKKDVTVALSSVSTEYNGEEHPVNASINGLIEGDEDVVAVVSYFDQATGSGITGAPVNKGVYTVVVEGVSSENYNLTGVTGEDATVTVTNVKVQVTVNNAVTAYGTGVIVPENGSYFEPTGNETFDNDANLNPYYVYDGDVAGLALGQYDDGKLTLAFDATAAGNYEIEFLNTPALTVKAADLGEVASLGAYTSVYNGNAVTLTVNGVKAGEFKLSYQLGGEDVSEIRNAGTYTVTVSPVSGNYTGSAQFEYTVEKATLGASLAVTSSVYDGNAVELAINDAGIYGNVVFRITQDGNEVTSIVNAGTYNVTILPGEGSNFTGSVDTTYTVNKAKISKPTRDDFNIAIEWNKITITDKRGNFDVYVSGNGVDWDDKTNTLTGLQANKSYNVAVKFAGNENYEESDVLNITVTTVSKPAASLDPEDVEYTVYYNKVVIDVNAEGEFEFSTDNSKWSTGNEITGLEANKEYTVYVRVKASESQEASEAVKITFTTGADPSGFNDKLANIGSEVTGDNFNDFKDILEEYEKLAEGDKAAIDTEKYEQLKSSYQAFVDTVNADIIAAQNVAKKAAGKGVAAAAAASVIATVIAAAVVAKKKFGF